MNSTTKAKLTIYFDGVCNLCNFFVTWLIQNDKNNRFQYASLQGETAKKSLSDTSRIDMTSIIVLDQNIPHKDAEALLLILKNLPFPYYQLSAILSLFPRKLLQACYYFIARHRYTFFGKQTTCRIPTAEEENLFLP